MPGRREEFRSCKAFVDWLREGTAALRAEGKAFYVHVLYETWPQCRFTASWSSRKQAPTWADYSFDGPATLKAAREIYYSVLEEHLSLFYQAECDMTETLRYRIFVAARAAIWRSIDPKYIPVEKSRFQEIGDEQFELVVTDLLGGEQYRQLIREHLLTGIGVRLVLQNID